MTTPSYLELVSAVRREGQGIIAAAGQGLDAAVPTCGDWQVSDLLLHVASVYRRAATAVGERATAAVPWQQPGDSVADPIGHLGEVLDDLVHALSEADAETPVWNWSAQPQVAGFWARRMTHESAVHRFDAQRAHGLAQPVDADVALDGFDELVDVILPRVVERDGVTLPTATYVFTATDDGAWTVRLDSTGVARLDTAKAPDVTVRGTASALLLAAYNRVPWTSLEIDGDPAALEAWSKAFTF